MYLHRVKTWHDRRQAGEITLDCLPENGALQQQCFLDFPSPPPPLNMAESILARSQAAVDLNREFTDRQPDSKKEEETRRKRRSPFLTSSFPPAAVPFEKKIKLPCSFHFFLFPSAIRLVQSHEALLPSIQLHVSYVATGWVGAGSVV